jgi:hypothetical protein
MYPASDKTKLVDIQTTVDYKETRRIWRHGKTYKFSKRWSEITKAGLAERDNTRNAPS